jgi:hypothetical protein
MLKSLAIGMLTLTAAVSTATFAGTTSPPLNQPGESLLCYILPFLCQAPPHQGGSGPTSAPEIDPASAAAALTLLAGGLAALRGWRSRKKDP